MASILERSIPSIPALSAAEMMRADACAETPAVFFTDALSFESRFRLLEVLSTAGDIDGVDGVDCVEHEWDSFSSLVGRFLFFLAYGL